MMQEVERRLKKFEGLGPVVISLARPVEVLEFE
jgi:hypothetical protein